MNIGTYQIHIFSRPIKMSKMNAARRLSVVHRTVIQWREDKLFWSQRQHAISTNAAATGIVLHLTD